MKDTEYYRSLPTWPDVEILGNDIDGNIPTTCIPSWKEFNELVSHGTYSEPDFIFRGHQIHYWDLIPSIARNNKAGVYDQKQADQLLDVFRSSSRGRKASDTALQHELELWALGQHYGLHTPLLDFTFSPFVALFFAFEKGIIYNDNVNESRVVFAINSSMIAEISIGEDKEEYEDILQVFEPVGESNARLLSQAGTFLFVPPNETIISIILNAFDDIADDPKALSKVITKIHIPDNDQLGCIKHLRRMNIHHASLFPDLIGASLYSNSIVAMDGNKQKDQFQPNKPVQENTVDRVVVDATEETESTFSGIDTQVFHKKIIQLFNKNNIVLDGIILKGFTGTLFSDINAKMVVDWKVRESIIAQIRVAIKRQLRRIGVNDNIHDSLISDLIEWLDREF